MGRRLKISVIGGGSTYTPELVEGLIETQSEIGVDTLALMDIDSQRLQVVGGLAARMLRAADSSIRLQLTGDRRAALEGSDFVIVQIRVGGNAQRVRDERIPVPFGIIGQETTGPGGFAKALRTVPVILEIARDVEALVPRARLIVFTNPTGLITEAVLNHSGIPTIGLCNSPYGMRKAIASDLRVETSRVTLDYIGLNHLSWARRVLLDGHDVTDRVLERAIAAARDPGAGSPFHAEVLETLRMIPSYYLRYYYHHDEVLAEQRRAGKSRGEVVLEVEQDLLRLYADPSVTTKPAQLEKRGGAHYSTVAVSLISAIANNKNEVHVVDTLNEGAIPDLPDDAVVEVPCVVGEGGASPQPTGALPLAIRGLVQAVKSYEQLTIRAAVEGDRRLALQALWAHPLVPSFSVAEGLLHMILGGNRRYLPQFK